MDVFKKLTKILLDKKYHIAAAESCTGGMFISSVIDNPGTSAVVDRSFVTYSEKAKNELLGVPYEAIERSGVVSEDVAFYMAKGVCERSGAEVGIGITGNAGPTDCDISKSVGTVCFGFCINGKINTVTKEFFGMDRNEVRRAACVFAAEKLVELLTEKI